MTICLFHMTQSSHEYVCDMTHTIHAWHDSLLIPHTCDMTRCLFHMTRSTDEYMCDMTHTIYVWLDLLPNLDDAFISWVYLWHDSHNTCVTWLTANTTHVWHDSFICCLQVYTLYTHTHTHTHTQTRIHTHTRIGHVTHANTSCHTYERVESRHTCERDMSWGAYD